MKWSYSQEYMAHILYLDGKPRIQVQRAAMDAKFFVYLKEDWTHSFPYKSLADAKAAAEKVAGVSRVEMNSDTIEWG